MNRNLNVFSGSETLKVSVREVAAELSVAMAVESKFRPLKNCLTFTDFKESLLCQTSCFAEASNAKYSASEELRVLMNCLSEMKNTGTMLNSSKTPIVERLVSLHPALSESAKETSSMG